MSETQRPEIGTTIDAGGIKTNYIEAGDGPAVVLVHGSGPGVTGYANWRLTMPTLAEQFRVIVPDMLGFGYTERPQGLRCDVDVWADQVVERGITTLDTQSWPVKSPKTIRADWRGPNGRGAESVEQLRAQVLDRFGVAWAIACSA